MVAKKQSININPKNAGKLRATLGVKKGQKIPRAKLVAATHSTNAKTRQRAQFALNARGFKHSKKAK